MLADAPAMEAPLNITANANNVRTRIVLHSPNMRLPNSIPAITEPTNQQKNVHVTI